MALESTTNKVKYSCNGALTGFDFTFPITQESDLEVIITTVATGVEQTLTLTTDYTVTASSNDFDNGGTVTTVATWSSAYTITIYRNVPLTQPSTFTENMTTLYQTFEDGLNRLTMIAQAIDERLDSALKIKKSDASATLELPIEADRASRYLAFDASGEPIASSGSPSSIVPVSSFMETLLDDTTATDARTTLDAQEETAASLALSALTPAANKVPIFTSGTESTALEITEQKVLGRITGGSVAALTSENLFSILGLTGMIIAWPLETPPTGFLECNGASLLRSSYASLFAIIGTTYGNVDATHFNLPDYRGYFLRGWDHGATNDPNAATRTDRGDLTTGDHVGTKQADEQEAHTHGSQQPAITITDNLTVTSGAGAEQVVATDSSGTASQSSSFITVTATQAAHTHASVGGSETRPLNINVMYCIKY